MSSLIANNSYMSLTYIRLREVVDNYIELYDLKEPPNSIILCNIDDDI